MQLNTLWQESSQIEQLTAFEEYIKEIEREKQNQKRNQLVRQGRLAREEFNKTLSNLFQTRAINFRSQWSQVVKDHLVAENSYLRLQEYIWAENSSHCSTARELFEEHCKEQKDLLKKHKDAFKQIVKTNQLRFPTDIQFEDFNTAIKKFSIYETQSPVNDSVRHLLLDYYVYKVKQKQADKEKKAIKQISNFILDNECLEHEPAEGSEKLTTLH